MISVRSLPAERCPVTSPTSRRFYIHERSFGTLVVAQPSMFRPLSTALGLCAASRAADQLIEDATLFGDVGVGVEVKLAAQELHSWAADALQDCFQNLVHLVPPKFGATAFLLDSDERVAAWCYEDGYFTYATDEDAAVVMYAETGSLKELRSRIRRSPETDPSLRMISGDGLFMVDQSFGAGDGTAKYYATQAARMLRRGRAHAPAEVDVLVDEIRTRLGVLLGDATCGGRTVGDVCAQRARFTLDMLLRSQPVSAGSAD